MRKERPLRESMQTKFQQQANSEKTNQRRNERTGRIIKRNRQKYPPQKSKKGNPRKEQTLYRNSES